MNNRIFFHTVITFYFLLCSVCATAQVAQHGSLSGSVAEWKGTFSVPVSDANVQLITAKNDTLGTAVTGGIFYFKKLPVGKTVIITSMVGMETVRKSITIVANKETKIDIQLREQSTQLKEVVVKGKAALVTLRQDTLIYNAAAVNTMEGDEAMKILEQMPGVEASDNEVTVMGKKIDKTYIDGKLVFGYNPLAALKNLAANDVVNIKVFDEYSNKNARKEILRGEKVRVLNIQTKSKLINSTSGHLLASGGANLNKQEIETGSNLRKGIGATGNFFSEKFILTTNAFHNNTGIRSNRIADIVDASSSGENYQENSYVDANFEYNKAMNNGVSQRLAGGYSYDRIETTSMSQILQSYFPTDIYQQRSYADSTRNHTINDSHKVNVSFAMQNASWGNLNTWQSVEFSNSERDNRQGIENTENDRITSRSLLHHLNSKKTFLWQGNIIYYHGTELMVYGASVNYTFNTNSGQTQRIDTLESSSTQLLLSIPADGNDISMKGSTFIKWALYKKDVRRASLTLDYGLEYKQGKVNQIGWNLLNPFQAQVDETNTYSYHSRTWSHHPSLVFSGRIVKDISLQMTASAYFTQLSRDEATADYYKKAFCTPFVNAGLRNQSLINSWSIGYLLTGELPTIVQLRPQIDNSNPYVLRSGNPGLKYALNHQWNFQHTKLYAKTGDMLLSGGSLRWTKNQIVARTTYFQTETPLPGLDYTAPAYSSLMSYENINGFLNASAFCNWRHPIRSIKSRYSIRADVSYQKNPYYVGSERVTTHGYSPSLLQSLSLNMVKNVSITLNARSIYTYSTNTKNESNKIFGQNLGTEVKIDQILKLLYVRATYGFQFVQNSGTVADITRNHKLNANVGCKLFKGKADISCCTYDVLNKFKNIKTVMMSNYVETTRTNYFGRYFTVNFAWRFNKIRSERSNLPDGGFNDVLRL